MDDQRFLEHRPDVVAWDTAPLENDVTIAGDIVARLFASTSGTDADWVVKLIDVYPENAKTPDLAGFQLMVANDVFRGRFRQSFEAPQAIVANKPQEYAIDLHAQNYRFLKGHPNPGAGAEQLVSADRPESPDLRAEHFPGRRYRLPPRDAAGVPHPPGGFLHSAADSARRPDPMTHPRIPS